jgi:2'-5' RNA ligase
MAFAVELYMDARTESLIKGVWTLLAQRGVSDNILKKGSRPHVALSVFDDCDPGEITHSLRKVAQEEKVLEARFEHLGTYCSKDGVLFLVPVVSPHFFLLHSKVFKSLHGAIQGLREGCKPNRFVPHCTVAYGLDKETLAKTVALFSNKALPIVGSFDRLGLVDLAHQDDKCIYPLKKD